MNGNRVKKLWFDECILEQTFDILRLRLDFIVMYTLYEIHKVSPPLLTHPGWHLLNTHAQGHTLMETDAIHWGGKQPFTAPREHGGTVSCSRAPRPWRGGGLSAVSFTNLWREWESNGQPSGYWTTRSNH